jgi:hypothetical protein
MHEGSAVLRAEVVYRVDVDAFLCDACDEEATLIAEASEEELIATTEMEMEAPLAATQ